MTTFFTNNANPFATPIGQLVEKSTDALSPDDNFEMYFEICDLVNEREENAKDAIRAIRKKLSIYSGKNWSVVLKLLKLLELCSNNCNKKFQVQLANKDLLSDLKSMIGPKLNPPMLVQEKVLYLIQHWATIFKNDNDFKPIEQFYLELRTKGVDFPVKDPDSSLDMKSSSSSSSSAAAAAAAAAALGATSIPNLNNDMSRMNISKTSSQPQNRPTLSPVHQPSINVANSQYQRLPESHIPGAAIKLNEEQVAKLNSELDVVDCNVQVLNEILNNIQSARVTAANSGASAAATAYMTPSAKDVELLTDLHRTCREMQKRIAQLIGSITNENVIGELLRINDDLNNAFLRYERYERSINPAVTNELAKKSSKPPTSPTATTATASSESAFKLPKLTHTKPDEKPLIDFSEEGDGVRPDDVLIKTSTSTKSPPAAAKTTEKKLNRTESEELLEKDVNEFLCDENEIKEMENWLKSSEGIKYNQELINQAASNSRQSSENNQKTKKQEDDLLM